MDESLRPGFQKANMATYSRLKCTYFTREFDPGAEVDRDGKQEGRCVHYLDVLSSWVQVLCLILWGCLRCVWDYHLGKESGGVCLSIHPIPPAPISKAGPIGH